MVIVSGVKIKLPSLNFLAIQMLENTLFFIPANLLFLIITDITTATTAVKESRIKMAKPTYKPSKT